MTERQNLLASIATTVADYRAGEIAPIDAAHVDRWISQFDASVQLPLLRETNHILAKSYYSKARMQSYVTGLAQSAKLAGANPAAFWANAKLLDIQGGGASQKDLNKELTALLNSLGTPCALPNASVSTFIYFDDGLFTGNRVLNDLKGWIATSAPASCTVHAIFIALHTKGFDYASPKIAHAAKQAGKSVTIHWWAADTLKDRWAEADNSDVLWPTGLPTDPAVQAYANSLPRAVQFRNPGKVGDLGFFSSDTARSLVEQEFLKAGVAIRGNSPNLNQYQRPLGNQILVTLGFGTMIATYRNCPNNAPLAIWAGSPWEPLLPRRTNSTTSFQQAFRKS